jgi:hypothetical protein
MISRRAEEWRSEINRRLLEAVLFFGRLFPADKRSGNCYSWNRGNGKVL